MDFERDTLESLLYMEEGPTLDFKREQYRFNKATKVDKSELLKDILAFANTQRYRTAYVLVGVEEFRGGRSEVVGVGDHLDDADLHQFVNTKTNRRAEFSYFPFVVDEEEIGVLSVPIQTPPIYVLSKYGIVDANTVYLRDGSSTRPASPDEIAAMGRNNPPRLVEWSIDRLHNMARAAVVTAAEQWHEHPGRHRQLGSGPGIDNYLAAREWVAKEVGERTVELARYPAGMDSYGSLYWVFRRFEELAELCARTIRTIGPALVESGALVRAIADMEECILAEKSVWDGFRLRMADELSLLPGEANYNILSLAARTVSFVDVLDDEDGYGDPDHGALAPHRRPVVLRSQEWGEWRR